MNTDEHNEHDINDVYSEIMSTIEQVPEYIFITERSVCEPNVTRAMDPETVKFKESKRCKEILEEIKKNPNLLFVPDDSDFKLDYTIDNTKPCDNSTFAGAIRNADLNYMKFL